jgi:hypothetical protein
VRASQRGLTQVVQLLARHGAAICGHFKCKTTPLVAAIENGHLEVVRHLIC